MNATASLYDTNLWVALTFPNHPHHRAASDEFALATPATPAVFSRSTQTSFLRLATTPAIMRPYGVVALTNDEALDTLAVYLALPHVDYWDEPPNTVPLWHRMAARPTSSPKIWNDAYLAAFAISGKLTFVTFDKGFVAYTPHGLDLRLLTVP